MLVCDAPVAIDLPQANSQSEQKAVLVYRIAGRVRSAPQDGDREGDVSACGNGEFSKVEGRTRLVVTEKQIPGCSQASMPLHWSGGGKSNITMSRSWCTRRRPPSPREGL